MRKTTLFLLALSLALVGCKPWLTPTEPAQNNNQPGLANPASVYCQEHGGQLELRTSDDGGQIGVCVFADGSECEEWSYYRGECQPESQAEDSSEEIEQLFMQKYNKNADEVSVTVSQQTDGYARGGVKFGRDGIGEGGIFLAAKVDGKWKLVFDGNGMIPCSNLKDYEFPESMTVDCFDFE